MKKAKYVCVGVRDGSYLYYSGFGPVAFFPDFMKQATTTILVYSAIVADKTFTVSVDYSEVGDDC